MKRINDVKVAFSGIPCRRRIMVCYHLLKIKECQWTFEEPQIGIDMQAVITLVIARGLPEKHLGLASSTQHGLSFVGKYYFYFYFWYSLAYFDSPSARELEALYHLWLH